MKTAVVMEQTHPLPLPGPPAQESWAPRIDWRLYRSVIALGAVMIVLAFLTHGTFLTARNITAT